MDQWAQNSPEPRKYPVTAMAATSSPGAPRFTRRQWFVLVVIGSVHFASAICISLQAPFYPQEAESKNGTATEYGCVFGVFELASFISSPILGKYIDVIGAKLLLNTGIFVAAVSNILFGLLDLVQTHVSFIVLSFVVRIVEAIGASAAVIASFAITAAVFPDSVATTFATLEIFYGLGYIAGPTIGGFLFTFGGYMVPFMVMGSILFVVGFFVLVVLPPFSGTNSPRIGLLQIFKVPSLILDAFSISATAVCMGFYSATLEPHIREFDLSPVSTGLVFIVSGATYAAMAPLVGRMCDTWAHPKYMIIIGTMLTILSVFAVGPAPFLPIDTKLWLVIVGLVLQGLGMACILVSGFIDAIKSAVSAGFPDDISTYGLMSGMWASSFALGAFVGPSVGGALFDLVQFRWGSMFIVLVHVILFVSVAIFLCRSRSKSSKSNFPSHISLRFDNEEKVALDPCKNVAANCSSDTELSVTKTNGYGTMANGRSVNLVQVNV